MSHHNATQMLKASAGWYRWHHHTGPGRPWEVHGVKTNQRPHMLNIFLQGNWLYILDMFGKTKWLDPWSFGHVWQKKWNILDPWSMIKFFWSGFLNDWDATFPFIYVDGLKLLHECTYMFSPMHRVKQFLTVHVSIAKPFKLVRNHKKCFFQR